LEHMASVKRFVSLQFLNHRQPVGLLGQGISSSQGRYLHSAATLIAITNPTLHKKEEYRICLNSPISFHRLVLKLSFIFICFY
jgi:hypothetical protein